MGESISGEWRAPAVRWWAATSDQVGSPNGAFAPELEQAGECVLRGDWAGAAYLLDRVDPADPLGQVIRAQLAVAAGDAWAAVSAMDRLRTERPDDPVVRHYLAAFLLAAADQARSVTRDDDLVIVGRRQLDTCEVAARRVRELVPGEPELATAADRLLAEVATGRRWVWEREALAVVLGVVVVVAGLALVVFGGLRDSVPLVVAGIVFGPLAIAGIVLAHRRQGWRITADRVAPLIRSHGLRD